MGLLHKGQGAECVDYSWPPACTAPVRWLPLAPLFIILLLAMGCVGKPAKECSPCAVPTDAPAEPPTVVPVVTPPDVNDSGYIMNQPWHVGDGWDYQSNQSNFHTVRVLKEALTPGHRLLLIEETEGIVGNAARLRYQSWIDGDTLGRYNITYVGGRASIGFDPPEPRFRFLHNGTFSFNETNFLDGSPTGKSIIRANAYYAGLQQVRLRWATVDAARMEFRSLTTKADGTSTRDLALHWAQRDYGADVQYELPSAERFVLVAVHYGEVTRGQLART